MAVFLRQCHFQKFATSVSKITIGVPQIFHCLAPPSKVSALALKAKTEWIKRSIHYVTLQRYNPEEATQRFFFSWHCLVQKKWIIIKMSSIKIIDLGVVLLEKEIFYALMHSLIWFSLWLKKKIVMIDVEFLGPYRLTWDRFNTSGRLDLTSNRGSRRSDHRVC